ncbi:MAG TPA: FecR family protein, partial [Polyangiaceae bacterium]|nr:FecR family protein [Polyangiaceae bacterium]
MNESNFCAAVDENMVDILEGVAGDELFEHLASCERCRDARYDAEQHAQFVRDAALDYRHPSGLEARILARIAAEPQAAAEPPAAEPAPAESSRAPLAKRPRSGPAHESVREPVPESRRLQRVQASVVQSAPSRHRRAFWIPLGAAAVALAVVWIANLGGSERAQERAGGAWQGEVLQVTRAFGSPSGLSRCTADGACEALTPGAPIPAGVRLETDGLTRARVRFADGSIVALDRASRLELDAQRGRRARLLQGNLVAEVQEQNPGASFASGAELSSSAALAVIDTPFGRAEVLGTKFSLLTERDRTRVEVSRGVVRLSQDGERTALVHAGEAGEISAQGQPRVENVLDLARAFSWSSEAFEPAREQESHGALGVLTAKRPRDQAELSGAVQLTQHDVQVQIVDNV